MNVHAGDVINWHGETHTVVMIRPGYAVLRSTSTGESIEILRTELEGTAELSGGPATREALLEIRELEDLDERERKFIEVWQQELDELERRVAAGVPVMTAYEDAAARVNTRLGTQYVGAKAARQRKRLAQHGLTGLLDRRRYGLAQTVPRAYDPRLIDAIMEVTYAQTRRSTGTKSRVLWQVREELDRRFGPRAVQMPARATLYRLLDDLGRRPSYVRDSTNEAHGQQSAAAHARGASWRASWRGGVDRHDPDGASHSVRRRRLCVRISLPCCARPRALCRPRSSPSAPAALTS